MPSTDWSVKGVSYITCSCDYGCPCQFEAKKPTHGYCQGFEALRIDRGHFGETVLDGLAAVLMYAWPGAVYEGNGTKQVIIDERADARQRDALLRIFRGEETEPFATSWAVYQATVSTELEPLFLPIELEASVEGRTARVRIPGILESQAQPIRSQATGEEHRVRIDLPNGVEYRLAEIGSGTSRGTGELRFEFKDTHTQFFYLHQTPKGLQTSEGRREVVPTA